jgi:hypothetical protein
MTPRGRMLTNVNEVTLSTAYSIVSFSAFGYRPDGTSGLALK